MSDRPPVDLSIGHYDAFETHLSQFLGIKILLVRDWERPETCEYSQVNGIEKFGSDDAAVQNLTRRMSEWLKKQFEEGYAGEDPTRAAARESLKKYICRRDIGVGATLHDEEVNSILDMGHVTLRENNCVPANTVIVFDKKFTREALKKHLFRGDFRSGWPKTESVPITNFIENFSIDPDDYRAFAVMKDIHHALSHQHEYEHNEKDWYHQPFYYKFAQLPNKPAGSGLWHGFWELPFDMAQKKYFPERIIGANANPIGIKDIAFFDKILWADALMNLRYAGLEPHDTLARLFNDEAIRMPNARQIKSYKDALTTRIENEIDKRISYHSPTTVQDWTARDDMRVTVPLFREIKDNLGLDEIGQKYIETVWRGLQEYMPTLAVVPMPNLDDKREPPRTVEGYRKAGLIPPASPPPSPDGPS